MIKDLSKYQQNVRTEISYQEYCKQIKTLVEFPIVQFDVSPTNTLEFVFEQIYPSPQDPPRLGKISLILPAWYLYEYSKSQEEPVLVSFPQNGETEQDVVQKAREHLTQKEMKHFDMISFLKEDDLDCFLYFQDGSCISCVPGYDWWMVFQKGDGTSYEYISGKFYCFRKKPRPEAG